MVEARLKYNLARPQFVCKSLKKRASFRLLSLSTCHVVNLTNLHKYSCGSVSVGITS
jgi:hypothetical protein